ncbi:hypothetical protein GGER_16440 [Serratia rubidaea]
MQGLACFLRQAENFVGIRQEFLALRRQPQRAVLADKQLNVQLLFKMLNTRRNVGLHPPHPSGGAVNAQLFRHHPEDFQ